MAASEVDFTFAFRSLCDSAEDATHDAALAARFDAPGAFHDWAERWRRRLAKEDVAPAARAAAMRGVNPAFIPRNHRVEEAIGAAIAGDFGPFETLVRVTSRPWDDQPDDAHLAAPPAPEERVRRTFCGT
jgi:uncharacterized protein YdiU (UPF0061 family)